MLAIAAACCHASLALGRCTALSLAAVRDREELVAAVTAAADSELADAAFAIRARDMQERRSTVHLEGFSPSEPHKASAAAVGPNVRHATCRVYYLPSIATP